MGFVQFILLITDRENARITWIVVLDHRETGSTTSADPEGQPKSQIGGCCSPSSSELYLS
jgi:hypothetical protein